MWKHHVVYESPPHSVIVTLGRWHYRVPEVVSTSTISLILEKKCQKVICMYIDIHICTYICIYFFPKKKYIYFLFQMKSKYTFANISLGTITLQEDHYRD
jgi:hypothetical protein